MKPRTRARVFALQVLYEVDMTNHLPIEVFQNRLAETKLAEDVSEFARQLVFGVSALTKELDEVIARFASEWPFDQLAAIDRNILRMACWEFAVERCTPTRVAINEAVELAKKFGSENAPRFINGVLGGLSEHENDIHQLLGKVSAT